MKTYLFPPIINLKPYRTKTYIYDKNGTVTWNCKPELATRIYEHNVYPSYSWPIAVLVEIANEGDKLLCVLAERELVHRNHKVYIYWHGWSGKRIICLLSFKIKYKWWSWKVLTRSKKLFWYGGMWA